jgi:mono/diheme cytochrome c family protein
MKKVKFMDWPFLLILFFLIMGPLGTKFYLFYNHALYTIPYNWMETQTKLTPQNKSEVFADQRGMQTPVEETIAHGSLSQKLVEGFGQEDMSSFYANPVAVTAESLKKGADYYRVYCSVCHGDLGNGGSTGKLKGGHFAPPSFHSQKLKEGPDGLIYQVIMRGQNSMASYAKQIPVDARWAIVNYIRVLQRSQGAKDSDLDIKINDESTAKAEVNSAKEGSH